MDKVLLELLRDQVGLSKRASQKAVLTKAVAMLMVYAEGERLRKDGPIGFSAGSPADGEREDEYEDDE